MTEEANFVDAETWTGGKFDKLTFRDLVMQQLKKISLNANKEFTGGYWNTQSIPVPISGGATYRTIKTYVPDSREVYSNSIEYLFDILFPHADKQLLQAGEIAEEELSQAYGDSLIFSPKKDTLKELEPEQKEKYIQVLKKWMKFYNTEQKLEYRDMRLRILRKLFREISSFLKRNDYFEGQVFEDEI